MDTNGSTVKAEECIRDGFGSGTLDKRAVLVWLFGARRDMGFAVARSDVGKKSAMEGGRAAVDALIRAINTGTFDKKV